MEKKNSIKINLVAVFLIISLIIIIIIGFCIHKLYNDKHVFELDSKNKYTITTDMRWMTMQNDGGSHSSLYYEIDLDNNIINKVQEDYRANLGGTPSKQINVIYTKKINTSIQEDVRTLLNEIILKEDINENHNYHSFTISSLNTEKKIYNVKTIENINLLLKKIDELKN